MPSRRSFLQSALFLPSVLSVQAFAQNNPASPAAPFADFENGWNDWTTEGDAFGTAPTTGAAFPGKITGYNGNGFVCTLHPKRGNTATGKAISRAFTIDKPFITFKIGGGNFPHRGAGGAACLNLVVDGKTERTETGDGSAQLVQRSWDVSGLVGKTARLEIVDSTTSERRGYVMVDDIAFSDAVKNEGVGWRDKSVEPFFITRAKLWQGVDFRNGESPFPFELPETDIQRAIDAVVVAIHAPDMALAPVAERSVQRIAAQIVAKVDATIAALNLPKVNPFTRQWLLAEGVCEWVRLNVPYDHNLAKDPGTGNYKYVLSQTKTIFDMTSPKGECWGIATVVRDLARTTGLKCDMVRGYLLDFGMERSLSMQSNHSWVCFVFDGAIELPSDVSAARTAYETEPLASNGTMNLLPFKRRKILSNYILPRHPEEWELYLATHFSKVSNFPQLSGDKQNVHTLSTLSFNEWVSVEIGYLRKFSNRHTT